MLALAEPRHRASHTMTHVLPERRTHAMGCGREKEAGTQLLQQRESVHACDVNTLQAWCNWTITRHEREAPSGSEAPCLQRGMCWC